MKKYIILFVIAFGLGWILSYKFRTPTEVVITKDKIVANTINKNIGNMTDEEKVKDLQCFYTATPGLDIRHIQDDEYDLTAYLCEREWSRKVKIETIAKQYRNLIILNTFFDSNFKIGLNTQYYKMFGRFGVGGGVSFTQGYAAIQAGVLMQW
jgi:hypothetical protein